MQRLRCRIILRSKDLLRVLLSHLLSFTDVRVSLYLLLSFAVQCVLQYAISVALTYLLSTQIFESWAQRSIDVVILAQEAVLSSVVQWVEFVAPVSGEIEESDGGFWGKV